MTGETNLANGNREYGLFLDFMKMRFSKIPTTAVSITAAADAGGGLVTFSAAGHDFSLGDVITQSTFVTNTDYNDDFTVVSAVPGVSYTVAVTWGSTEAGSVVYHSAVQGKLHYVGRALPGTAEDAEGWIMHRHLYDIAGFASGQNFAVGGAETNQPAFKWSDRATYEYGT